MATPVWAALQHDTTPPKPANETDADFRSAPVPHPTIPTWIYTKFDRDTQFTQVYMQYHNPAASPGSFAETRLTISLYDKRQAAWGPKGKSQYFPVKNPNNTKFACTRDDDVMFFFLGDNNADGRMDLNAGCLDSFPAAPINPLGEVDIALSNATKLDIDYYKADRIIKQAPTNKQKAVYFKVVLTTKPINGKNEMHLMMYEPANLKEDGSNYFYNPKNWPQWKPLWPQYATPQFFNDGRLIIFSARAGNNWQLGGMSALGNNEVQITDIGGRDFTEPLVLDVEDSFKTAVFTIDAQHRQLGSLRLRVLGNQIVGWCAEGHILTTGETDRMHPDVYPIGTGLVAPPLHLVYEKTQSDGDHDIFYAESKPDCVGGIQPAPAKLLVDDFVKAEVRLTCEDDNLAPLYILPLNTEDKVTGHVTKVSTPGDVIFLSRRTPVAGSPLTPLIHLNDVPTPTVCAQPPPPPPPPVCDNPCNPAPGCPAAPASCNTPPPPPPPPACPALPSCSSPAGCPVPACCGQASCNPDPGCPQATNCTPPQNLCDNLCPPKPGCQPPANCGVPTPTCTDTPSCTPKPGCPVATNCGCVEPPSCDPLPGCPKAMGCGDLKKGGGGHDQPTSEKIPEPDEEEAAPEPEILDCTDGINCPLPPDPANTTPEPPEWGLRITGNTMSCTLNPETAKPAGYLWWLMILSLPILPICLIRKNSAKILESRYRVF